MNIEIKNITKIGPKIVKIFDRYKVIFLMIVLLLIFGLLVINIGRYSTRDPSQSEIDERIKTVQVPKIDQEAVSKILELEDQNIEVKSLFEDARNNPFSEN